MTTTRARLRALTLGFACAFAALAALSAWTVSRVRVNGPLYREISRAHGLQADAAPPALFVIEPYLLALQISQEYDAAKRQALGARFAAHEAAYRTSLARWERDLPDGSLKKILLGEVRPPADAIFAAVGKDLLPGIADGDAMRSLKALDAIKAAYATHVDAVGRLDAAVEVETAEAEARAGRVAGGAVATLAALAALTLAGGGLAGWRIARRLNGSLTAVAAESARVHEAIAAGDLAVRADPAAVDEEFRPTLAGLNATVDALAAPVRVVQAALARIARGDLPPPVAAGWKGDFAEIERDLDRCIAAVNGLVADASGLAEAAVRGDLGVRADASRHEGDFRRIVQGVNDALDAVVGPLRTAASQVDSIARGAIPPPVEEAWRGDFEVLRLNLNACAAAVTALVADTGILAAAAVEGRLSVRADGARHAGDFRRIVEGVNGALDAVVGPLGAAAEAVDRMARGEIPPTLDQPWRGDFERLRQNLNASIEAVNALTRDAALLAGAATDGDLAQRADAAQHRGDFRSIVEGVNLTLDTVVAPLREAAGVLERLARRDLTARATGRYRGDHRKIQEALNATAGALEQALSQVREASTGVAGAAGRIAGSARTVAEGAERQAVRLEGTVGVLAGISARSRSTAERAQEANGLARRARDAAGEGAVAVDEMAGAMDRIRASAEGTAAIIRDINDIAFQTNLLALNAAVEAARAGDAGRGFAVVAGEVRNLALRSKEAANRTDRLIKESVKQASEGEATSRRAAARLADIVAGVDQVTAIVREIDSGAREQATGVDGVEKAVAELQSLTQASAKSAGDTSAEVGDLAARAEDLARLVASFQLGEGGGGDVEPTGAEAGARGAAAPHARTQLARA